MSDAVTGKLAGRTVIVVGGSSGIGLACTKSSASEGAKVVVTGRSRSKLERARSEITSASPGSEVEIACVDVTDEGAMREFFSSLDDLDHLVFCAGEAVSSTVVGSDTQKLRATVETRVWGGYFAAKYAAPLMKSGSSITFVSGLSAHRPYPGSAMTAASTGAIESFSRALALELASIRVNAICPGIIDTGILDSYYGDEKDGFVQQLSERLPVERIGTPEDIAHAALYLMTSGFVTGTVLRVDGGGALI